LYPKKLSVEQLSKINTSSAPIVLFEIQLRKLEATDLALLKDEILGLISAKEAPN
jgi:hypothetical protein